VPSVQEKQNSAFELSLSNLDLGEAKPEPVLQSVMKRSHPA